MTLYILFIALIDKNLISMSPNVSIGPTCYTGVKTYSLVLLEGDNVYPYSNREILW